MATAPFTSAARRAALAAVVLLGCGSESTQDGSSRDSPRDWRGRYREMARLGDGFVVWESNRTGRWRLWQVGLDGEGLRQLSPDEEGRDHFAAHVSPDGRRVAYLSYPVGEDPYKPVKGGAHVPMRLLDLSTGESRVLVPDARPYDGNRSAVWVDPRRLVHIGGDGATREIDIETGESVVLVEKAKNTFGFLVNATRTHATTGRPTFSVYDPERRAVERRRRQEGCEPYFSRDGRWGFWIAHAGGPIRRIDLRTGQTADLLVRDDPRMPPGLGYVYFPMVSPGQRLLAFSASRSQHDHFRADYEIFVAPIDPDTLELQAAPVRYTFDPATDRFPDVWLAGLELGRHRGEAPLRVELEPPQDGGAGAWSWDFGDGAPVEAARGEHVFERPGSYQVRARRGDTVFGGEVKVEPGRPPEPLRVVVRQDGQEVDVLFDEPIALGSAYLRLARAGEARAEIAGDGRTLRLFPERPVDEPDRLLVAGIADRAQVPNVLEARELAVEPNRWPSRSQGLALVWHTAHHQNLVRDPESGAYHSNELDAQGRARIDHDGALVPGGGGFRVRDSAPIVEHIRKADAFGFEITLRAAGLDATEPGAILSLGRSETDRSFALFQEGRRLVLRIRTDRTKPAGGGPITLLELPDTEPHHLRVSVGGRRVVAWLDGRRVFEGQGPRGRLAFDTRHAITLGFEWGNRHPWRGALEGLAIYTRVANDAEAAASAKAYLEELAERDDVPQIRVRARRLAGSRAPALGEIAPYRDALAVHEYEIREVLSGEIGPARIRVAHYAIQDGEVLDVAEAETGEAVELLLESFDDNPQVEALVRADDLPIDPAAPLFLDVGP